MNIIFSENAIKNIKRLQIENNCVGHGIRYGYTNNGCSGYKYLIEFEDSPGDEDIVFKFDDIEVYVSKDHIDRLKGSSVDWKDTLMESGFKIENPQAKRECGCGESFDFDN